MANVLWALATLEHYDAAAFHALARAAAAGCARYSPAALSQVMWACARCRHRDGPLLAAAGKCISIGLTFSASSFCSAQSVVIL